MQVYDYSRMNGPDNTLVKSELEQIREMQHQKQVRLTIPQRTKWAHSSKFVPKMLKIHKD